MLYMPSPEQHARYAAAGMTRYTYAEVGAAFNSYRAQESRHTELVALADDFYTAQGFERYPGWENTLTGANARLMALLGSALIPCADGGRLVERFPVASWNRATKTYTTLNNKLEQAIAHAQR